MASVEKTTRPKVLHIYKDYYPPVLGGVEMTINLLAEGCRLNYEATVLVNSGSRRSYEEEINGVRVVRISELGRAASAPLSPGFISALKREAEIANILHFHHPNPTGDLARFLSRPKSPAVMTYHSDVVRQRWAMIGYAPLQQWMMNHCDVIMPTSPNYLESSQWLQRHRDRCTVVPLGIRTDIFQNTPQIAQHAEQIKSRYTKPLVIFVGRLRYYKGLQYLVQAMGKVEADLLVAGTGPMEAALRHQARELNLSEKIHFLGDVSDAEKLAYYYASDVFCMPSHLRSEAFGLSQVEAMLTGLPVVSTRIASGVPFVNLDGISGLTVPPEDSAALAEALNSLIINDALRNRLGNQARERAQTEFSASRMCENVMQVYERVLQDNPSPLTGQSSRRIQRQGKRIQRASPY